jgi:hypothetical protein
MTSNQKRPTPSGAEKNAESDEKAQPKDMKWSLMVFPPDASDEDIAASIRAQAKAAKEAREAKEQVDQGESGDQGTDAGS